MPCYQTTTKMMMLVALPQLHLLLFHHCQPRPTSLLLRRLLHAVLRLPCRPRRHLSSQRQQKTHRHVAAAAATAVVWPFHLPRRRLRMGRIVPRLTSQRHHQIRRQATPCSFGKRHPLHPHRLRCFGSQPSQSCCLLWPRHLTRWLCDARV